jgi:DNA topoisomerase I
LEKKKIRHFFFPRFKPGEIDFGDQDALLKFFNEANRKVAVLCNHQKAAGKGHSEAVEKLTEKAKALSQELKVLKQHLNLLENGKGGLDPDDNNPYTQKLPKDVQATKKKMIGISTRTKKLAHQIEIKEGNKNVSLTTSKINYMDPRVAIAFCKRTGLDISKVG